MTSITEDPSLPLDMDGTSNVLSNSQFGSHDSTEQDLSSSMSSELEHPGMFRNLTSAGKVSPHRTRTMKDQEAQLGEYKKENFGLKLRIYHLEEVLRRKWGDSDDGWKMNIELQVQLGSMRRELEEKGALLLKAKQAIDQMSVQHDAHIRDMQDRAEASNQTEALDGLRRSLAEREEDLEQALREAENGTQQMHEMQDLNDGLTEELRDKDDQLGRMQRELEDLQRALEERDAAPARPHTAPRACQTVEPLPAMLAQAADALEAAQAELVNEQAQNEALKTKMADKDRQIQQLEMDLLSSSQKLAAGAGDHAMEMQDQASELDRCRGKLKDLADKLRDKEAELRGVQGEREGAWQQAREAETLVQRLQPLVAERDKEIQDLQRRLEDAGNRERAKDEEMSDLKGRLRDAESRARQAQPDIDAKQREIEMLTKALEDRDDEMEKLKAKLREVEDALSHARRSAHRVGVDNREQNEALKKLGDEIEALRAQVARQQHESKGDLDAALAAKDAALEQMQRQLEELQSKLDTAEQTILHLTTSKAAEMGVLRATIDDLNRQLEHLERLNRDLRSEVGRLTGEKAGLEREVAKLRDQNEDLRDQLAAMESELAEKRRDLTQAEETIVDLQKLIDDLRRRGEQNGANQEELASLRALLATRERALRNKEAELEALTASLALKDRLIAELQEEVGRLGREGAGLAEHLRELEKEKNNLEAELAKLRSQARISKLASDDLQSKLTQAFGEREELARKLHLAQDALREKETVNTQFEDRLRDQIDQLQHQLEEFSHHTPPHVTVTTHKTTTTTETDGEAKPAKDGKGASSTTMIFGSSSDSILLTILQRLQELSAEITAGRTDSNVASSSLSSKLEHLTALQRHLEDSLNKERPSDTAANISEGDTHYTNYYFMGGEEEETTSDTEHPVSSTPKKTPPHRRLSSDLAATTTALRDATAQVGALQSELDELKRWNSELQARLDDSRPPPNYQQLEGDVDRLVAELDAERERSKLDRTQQQQEFDALQEQLKSTEDKVVDLEHQLGVAMRRDAGTSTDGQTTSESLQSEIEKLVNELDSARATISTLRGKLDAEKNEAHRLRTELSELRVTHSTSQQQTDDDGQASSSMPNLLSPKHLSESWTSPAKASVSLSERPDVKELKRKHEEVTRLNQELQRKCQEQLFRSPSSSRPSSGGHSTTYWQGRLREQEDRLRTEMMERERVLLVQIREAEASTVESEEEWRQLEGELRRQVGEWRQKEEEWRQLEGEMRQQVGDLEGHLSEALRSGERRFTEVTAECRLKDEEIQNLSKALSGSQEKLLALEGQLDTLLRDKNAAIAELEGRLIAMDEELRRSGERMERLRRDGGGAETEVTTLHETVDSLTQQLTSRIEDINELERKNRLLEEQKMILNSQLASAQEQILMLKEELALYKKLLDEKHSDTTSTTSVDLKQVLQLLEEIRRLREQLDQSIRSNQALSEQLQSRLEQTRSETTLHFNSQASPGGYVRSTQTSPPKTTSSTGHTQTTPPRRHTSRVTSPHVRVSSRSTSTRVPVSSRATGTKAQGTTGRTTISLNYDSESSAQQSFSENKLSDTSASSLSQPHTSPSTHRRSTAHTSTSTTAFTPPKDSSTPHTRHSDPLTRTSTHSTSFSPGTKQKDHSTMTSRLTHSKTTTTSRKGSDQPGGGAGGGKPRGEGRSAFSWTGTGDFDSLETRLQQALNSPSLPAADRSFLEDLLHYLRQQRKQLDDSRRLLERIEESSIPSTTHIHVDTAESGTLPSPPHAHTGSQATPLTASHTQTPPRSSTQTTPTQSTHATTNTYSFHSERSSVPRTSSSPGMGMGQGKGMGNGSFSETYTYAGPPKPTESGGKAGKVDLSKLYEQLLQTHSSLAEARSSLSQQRKQ